MLSPIRRAAMVLALVSFGAVLLVVSDHLSAQPPSPLCQYE